MNRHESLSPQSKDKGISFGFMAAIIPFAASMLLEEVLFHARKGVLIEAHHLEGPDSQFKDQEIIPTDLETNSVIIPSGAVAEVNIGTRTYIVHDFYKEALIKYGGRIKKRPANPFRNQKERYQMLDGKAVTLTKKNPTYTFGDRTLAAWRH